MWPLQTLGDRALGAAIEWGPFLVLVVASLVVAYAMNKAIKRLGKFDPPGERFDFITIVIRALHPLLVVAGFSATFYVGVNMAGTQVPPGVVVGTVRLQWAIFILLVAVVFARTVSGFVRQRAKKEPRWTTAATLGVRLLDILVYVVALLVILGQYDVEITPVLTSLGIAGLAVALALQDTLANFFAGIWLQTGKSLNPGHYIMIEDQKLEGFVIEIGWRTTKVRTLPGNVFIIPNSILAQSTITDYWLPEPKMGTNLTVVTGFEADPDRVVPMIMEEIRAAQNEVDYILKGPEPFCRLNKRVDNGWEFWMSFWIPFYYDQWNAQGYVLNKIRRRFEKEGIRFPYPTSVQIQVEADPKDMPPPRRRSTRPKAPEPATAEPSPSRAGWTSGAR